MADIVERLKSGTCGQGCGTMTECICATAEDAADTITALRGEVERLNRRVDPEAAKAWIEGLGDVLGELKDKQIDTLRAENAALREALEEIRDLPGELNPSNYDHDDVVACNYALGKTWQIARAALASAPQKAPDWEDVRGIAPNATGDLSSEDWVRQQRDQWDSAALAQEKKDVL